jgi:hypothetical protein
MQIGGAFEALAVTEETAYLGIGASFATIDISDPAAPERLWQSEVLPGRPAAIAVQPGLAFVRVGTELWIYNVSDPAQPDLVGKMNGVSGDLIAAGESVFTFAVGGEMSTLLAINVSDPAHPAEAGRRQVTSNTRMAVSQDILYLASGGGAPNARNSPGILELVDPANLERTLSEIPLGAASNYALAVENNFVFVVENRHFEKPDLLVILEISDPAHPREVARLELDIEQTISGIVASDKSLFLLSRSFPHSGCPTSIHVIGTTDPAVPQVLVRLDPQSCFNHFAVVGDKLAATSERGLEIFNIGDLPNIAPSGVSAPNGFLSVGRVALYKDLAYLFTTAGGNRLARLKVMDVASIPPELLNGDGLELGDPEPSIFEGLSVRGERLFGLGPTAVDISDPASPRMAVGDIGASDKEGVFYWPPPVLVENALYTGLLTNTPDGLRIGGGLGIVDVSDPTSPILLNRVPMEGFTVSAMAAVDKRLIVYSEPRLRVYDVSDPFNPVEVAGLDLSLTEPTMDIAGDTVYLASRSDDHPTLVAVDISDPTRLAEVNRFELPEPDYVKKIVASGETIYIHLDKGGIVAVNVSEEFNPYLSGKFTFPISDFAVAGNLLYLAAEDAGLLILRVGK